MLVVQTSPPKKNWAITKNGWTTAAKDSKYVFWQVTYNPSGEKLTNVVLHDVMGKGQTYVEGSFEAFAGTVDQNNQFHTTKTLDPQVIQNDQSLTIDFGNISTAISFRYKTKPNANFAGTLTNNASDTNGNQVNAEVSWGGKGTGDGYTGEVELTKIDADTKKPLADAEFKLINNDTGKVVKANLLTNKDGRINVEALPTANYEFIETKAPNGYKINSSPIKFTINGKTGQETKVSVTAKNVKLPPTPVQPKTTSINVQKIWADQNNKDGIRPKSIKVQLLKDGESSGAPVVLSKDNNWSYVFSKLQTRNKNGEDIKYAVKEIDVPAGYISKVGVKNNNVTITNIHTPNKPVTPPTPVKPDIKKGKLTVKKIWDDQNDKDGIRPKFIKVQLFKNGVKTGAPVILSKENDWSYSWNNLIVSDNGVRNTYTVNELEMPVGYTANQEIKNGVIIITNSHTPITSHGSKIPVVPNKPKRPMQFNASSKPKRTVQPKAQNRQNASVKRSKSIESQGLEAPIKTNKVAKSTKKLAKKATGLLPQTGNSRSNLMIFSGIAILAFVALTGSVVCKRKSK